MKSLLRLRIARAGWPESSLDAQSEGTFSDSHSRRGGGGVWGWKGHFLYGAVQGCAAGIGILLKPEII